MSAGFISFVATNIQDALGRKLASGTLEVLPTDNYDRPINASCSGILLSEAASVPVANGTIPSGTTIPASSATLPPNVSFRITIRDAQGKQLIALPGVQPSGSQFNLDTYVPNVASQVIVQYGPQGQGFTYRGLWQPNTQYNPYDVFTQGNNSYEVGTAFISGSAFATTSANYIPFAQGSSAFRGLQVSSSSGGVSGADDYNVAVTDDIVEYSGSGSVSFYHQSPPPGTLQIVFNTGQYAFNCPLPLQAGPSIPPGRFCLFFYDGSKYVFSGYTQSVVTPNSSPYQASFTSPFIEYNGPGGGVINLPPIDQGNENGAMMTIYCGSTGGVYVQTALGAAVGFVGQKCATTFALAQNQWLPISFSVLPFGGSGSNHAAGLVPDPGATAGTQRFLREDGGWAIPPGTGTGGGSGGSTYTPQDISFIVAAVNAAGIGSPHGLTLPSVNAPQLGCVDPVGSGMGYMSFSDSPASPQYAFGAFGLPTNWTGSDISLSFFTPAIAGAVNWLVETAFVPVNSPLAPLSYAAAATLSTNASATANGLMTTATQQTFASPGVRGAAAGGMMHIRISRAASDTAVGVANLIGITLTTRRSV